MINIINETINISTFVDHVVRSIGGSNVLGVSMGHYGTIVHLQEATPESVQSNIATFLGSIGNLTVTADKTLLTADDVDEATITIDTAEPSLSYITLLDGEEYATDTVASALGVVTLTLKTDLEGVYDIYVFSSDGSQSGKVTITAEESV